MKPNKTFWAIIFCLTSCKTATDEIFLHQWVCVAQSPTSEYNYLGKIYTVYKSKVGDFKEYDFTGDGLSIQCVAENDSTLTSRSDIPSRFKFKYLNNSRKIVAEENGKPNGLEWEAVK